MEPNHLAEFLIIRSEVSDSRDGSKKAWSNPQAGECWVVAATASDAWSEREEMLACWDGEQWTFCQPLAGMHVYNADSGERWVYRD